MNPNNKKSKGITVFLTSMAVCAAVLAPAAWSGEWSGFAGLEFRGYAHEPLFPQQERNDFSLVVQPEYYHRIEDSRDSFIFIGFARTDHNDSERTHADIRELAWIKVGEDYELRLGIRKVFWGATEVLHLVDVVNQTDLVENIDGEDKLGQPMINLALFRSWGTLDFFVLPGFRERTFPGPKGRLRTEPYVDTERAQFESGLKRRRVDLAVRWSKTFENVDIGLSHFAGTGREPTLSPGFDSEGNLVLIPRYELIHQTSLDLTAVVGSWLWKLETMHRSLQGPSFTAMTGGFEYTFTGIFGSNLDLGVLAEYMYDERAAAAPAVFQDDVMVGLRLAFNDVQSSEFLLGIIDDRRSSARFYSVEASRRFGDSWKLTLEGRAFADIPVTDPFFSVRRDDSVQIEFVRYF